MPEYFKSAYMNATYATYNAGSPVLSATIDKNASPDCGRVLLFQAFPIILSEDGRLSNFVRLARVRIFAS
jgi:hypothetical protein